MRPFNQPSFPPDGPCPCLSGRPARRCCLTITGEFRKEAPSAVPPGPLTNFQRNGCYLAPTNNCGTKITSEHFVSRNVLESFPGGIAVSGLPRQAAGTSLRIGINSAGVNVLCDRHNSAFQGLDAEAGQLFRALQAIDQDFARKSISRKGSHCLISGEAIELWALKAACGLYYSGIGVKDGAKLHDTHVIDLKKVIQAIARHRWGVAAGLYLNARLGSGAATQDTLSVTPALNEIGNEFVGMRLLFRGLEFHVIFDTEAVSPPKWPGFTYRPSHLIFRNAMRRHVIEFTWPHGSPYRPVTLDLRRIVRPKKR
jgi:hypothetical protein